MKLHHSFLWNIRLVILLTALVASSFAFCGEIHQAAKDGNLEKVKALLQTNPRLVSSKDEDGRTPLHWAAAGGHKDVVVFLLSNEADIRAKDNSGETPYDLSTTHGDVAELLRQNGGRKKTSSHDTAIFDAATNGDLSKVKELVEDDPDIVFFEDASHPGTRATALAFAAINNRTDVVKYLLDHKANVNAKDADNQTPLMGAADYNHKEMVELLLSRGADINIVDTNSALDKDPVHGRTALHGAAFLGFKEVVQVLLDHNADVTIQDRDRHTALDLAKMRGNKEIVELLLQHGVQK